MKWLVGRTDLEHAFRHLDSLTKEEGLISSARNLEVTHNVDSDVETIKEVVHDVARDVEVTKELTSGVDSNVTIINEAIHHVNGNVSAIKELTSTVSNNIKAVEGVMCDVDENVKITKHCTHCRFLYDFLRPLIYIPVLPQNSDR